MQPTSFCALWAASGRISQASTSQSVPTVLHTRPWPVVELGEASRRRLCSAFCKVSYAALLSNVKTQISEPLYFVGTCTIQQSCSWWSYLKLRRLAISALRCPVHINSLDYETPPLRRVSMYSFKSVQFEQNRKTSMCCFANKLNSSRRCSTAASLLKSRAGFVCAKSCWSLSGVSGRRLLSRIPSRFRSVRSRSAYEKQYARERIGGWCD